MKLNIRWFALVTIAIMLLTAGCPSPPKNPGGTDTTGPQMLDVVVRVESPTPRDFNITSQDTPDITITPNSSIRIIATTGDAETGIAAIRMESELRWRCRGAPNSPITGVLEQRPLTFVGLNQPATPVTPVQVNAVTQPLSLVGCFPPPAGRRIDSLNGFIRVVAVNGAGGVTKSKTFLFKYDDIDGQ